MGEHKRGVITVIILVMACFGNIAPITYANEGQIDPNIAPTPAAEGNTEIVVPVQNEPTIPEIEIPQTQQEKDESENKLENEIENESNESEEESEVINTLNSVNNTQKEDTIININWKQVLNALSLIILVAGLTFLTLIKRKK